MPALQKSHVVLSRKRRTCAQVDAPETRKSGSAHPFSALGGHPPPSSTPQKKNQAGEG
jgi:hypothetical protein